MLTWAEVSRPLLEQVTLRVLRENVAENGSALPPFRLPQLGQQIVAGVMSSVRGETSTTALAFGEQLGGLGLGLRSWLAVSRALTHEFVSRACRPGSGSDEVHDAAAVLTRLHEFLTRVVDGLAHHDLTALSHERDEIHKALERVIATREGELRRVIQELSTPVMPVYAQILALPIIGAVDDERAARITERLLDETVRRQARIVIIDVTGLSTTEPGVFSALTRTIRAVQLLGARALLVGIPAEVARSFVEHGVDITGLSTLSDLQSGIEWALKELGLAIGPQTPAKPVRTSPASRGSERRSKHHGD